MKMTREARHALMPYLPLFVLPAVHIFLVALTTILSRMTPGGAYYRILGVDFVAAPIMMVFDNAPIIVGVLLIVGTALWYFIGWIGWESSKGKISRLSAAVGGLFALFFGAIGALATKEILYEDLLRGSPSVGAILQYACVGVLCLGAFVVTIYSAIAALGRREFG
jgi:hypothetical protein